MGEASDSYLFVEVDSSVSLSERLFLVSSIDLLEREGGGVGERFTCYAIQKV